ncbi:NAD(P)-dependent dehydrogenase (short-subunit alcohol dehydrogenase family) [Cellulophaga sp. RHA19]|uniref:SDR family NAD(P)-dependent oxidoreductase n=1 Tax=Cellulophaga sp. RHA19 TaxID=1798237 RepID=UPI000CBDB4C8|nr:SDR family oxidoreductase [Cellulophaga sp. RHA19]PKB44966.1 NAD(P)-dependent dehydrogenase (short-subunit alcohol dehydrogenase family) [Cellulophaga sp. RHA19]
MMQNKIVLVTGGSRGLGKNMAISLAKKGLDIILTYNSSKDGALAVVKEIETLGSKAAVLHLNVDDTKNFDSFFLDLKTALREVFNVDKLDFLVNNAGIGINESIKATTEDQFDKMVNIHFKAPFFLAQKVLPYLNNEGGIVNISTGLTRFTLPGYAAYAASKGAVEVLSLYLAKELGKSKIRVNTVAPGAIETDFGGGAVRDNKNLNDFIGSQTALGRVGVASDIGSVVAFLCTDDAKWINAQRIEVSGGQMI